VTRCVQFIRGIVPLTSTTLEDSIREILDGLVPDASEATRQSLCDSILQRERLNPTMLPDGTAFPRAEYHCIDDIVCIVGVSDQGIQADQPSDVPIRTLYVSLYPEGCFKHFVPVLKDLVRFSQDPRTVASLQNLPRDKESFHAVRDKMLSGGIKDWIHSHLLTPLRSLRNRTEDMVRVRDD
jgi:mannitol/fructose-specific phosphotransferase system IIA component (Ntr-type)